MELFKELTKIWRQELKLSKEYRTLTPFFITGEAKTPKYLIVALNPKADSNCRKINKRLENCKTVHEIIKKRSKPQLWNKLTTKNFTNTTYLNMLLEIIRDSDNAGAKRNKCDKNNMCNNFKKLSCCKINLFSIPSCKFPPNLKKAEDRKIEKKAQKAYEEWKKNGNGQKFIFSAINGFISSESLRILFFMIAPKKNIEYIKEGIEKNGFQVSGKKINKSTTYWLLSKHKLILLSPQRAASKEIPMEINKLIKNKQFANL